MKVFLATAFAVLLAASVSALSGAAYMLVIRLNQTEKQLRDVISEHRMCSCTLRGTMDSDIFGIELAQVKATPETAESIVLGPQTACGPFKLQAWLGTP